MESNNKIETAIKKISELLSITGNKGDGLLSGNAGKCLFYAELYMQTNNDDYFELLEETLTKIIYGFQGKDLLYTFSDGLCGLIWLLQYLRKNDLIDSLDDELMKDWEDIIYTKFTTDIERNNWDYMHGATGAILCFGDNENIARTFVNHFVIDNDCLFDSYMYPKKTNLGIAHGLCSLLYFLNLCRKYDDLKEKINYLTHKIISIYTHCERDFLLSGYCFGSFLGEEIKSRLAWCYGDLSVAFFLCQTAINIKDITLFNRAITIAKTTITRKDVIDTYIIDSCFCHGSAGLVHLYNKFYKLTKLQLFREAADYWLDWTLHNIDEKCYCTFDRYSETWRPDVSILNGLSGIGLVFIDLLRDNHNKWDECLLLS